jgi:hypothetical protein
MPLRGVHDLTVPLAGVPVPFVYQAQRSSSPHGLARRPCAGGQALRGSVDSGNNGQKHVGTSSAGSVIQYQRHAAARTGAGAVRSPRRAVRPCRTALVNPGSSSRHAPPRLHADSAVRQSDPRRSARHRRRHRRRTGRGGRRRIHGAPGRSPPGRGAGRSPAEPEGCRPRMGAAQARPYAPVQADPTMSQLAGGQASTRPVPSRGLQLVRRQHRTYLRGRGKPAGVRSRSAPAGHRGHGLMERADHP